MLLAAILLAKVQSSKFKLNRHYALAIPSPQRLAADFDAKIAKNEVKNTHWALPHYAYRIQFGDDLEAIFNKLHISKQEQQKLFAADDKKQRLQKLKIDDELRFWVDQSRASLLRLEIAFNPELKTQFNKKGKQQFKFTETKARGKWQQKTIAGDVIGSFSLSARRAGLSFAEIDGITRLLRHRINLNRDMRTGDKFAVIRSVHYLHGKASGKSEIEAVRIQAGNQYYAAYLYIDGHYYDEQGNPIARTFLRYPTKFEAKVSSHYNLYREHPISKKSIPHKGTDFYANTGTKVIATADGVVKAARYHAKAGHYLVIDHGGEYFTRYLHNSKLLVHKGQTIKRGQVIAISGSSGTVTGPHIHYELWVKGRPINAMKAILPSHQAVPDFQRFLYQRLVKKYNKIMK